ncbi:hypothetical protein [Mycobacterium sp. OAE908]|uniref:hypothetical protein n=1 Tax=Mycobacterium sp. OAE908 TaxID=2817899 RepID=UPI001AE86423
MPTTTPPRRAGANYVHLRGRSLAAITTASHSRSWISHTGKWLPARLLFVLTLSGMPILAIAVDVFGIVPQRISAVVIVAMLAGVFAIMAIWPHRTDVIVGRALVAGMVACAVYDAFRLFAVHILGWMGDFIPAMGSWITGDGDTAGSAIVGYVWRYLGDGGGLGVAFYLVALAIGLDRYRARTIVLAAVGYAVFPVWAGLIATVALAPRGEELMFQLTPTTLTTTLIGHLIFGVVLGFAFVRTQRDRQAVGWPWPPLRELLGLYRARRLPVASRGRRATTN